MNLLCGVIGVIFTLDGRADIAFWLMLAAAVFDFCDGLAARALHAYSDIGKELDSLCDVVSFGVLPAIMMYSILRESCAESCFWAYIPLCIAIFSALRLAKFNVDERQHDSFIGLPTPACALICGSLAYSVIMDANGFLARMAGSTYFIPALSIVLSLLLVSEIPMFSMKFFTGKAGERRELHRRVIFIIGFILVTLLTIIFRFNWSFAIFGTFLFYIVQNICEWVVKLLDKSQVS